MNNKCCQGKCSWREIYIGETICNVEEHWPEHNSADSISEPAKHLADYEEHSYLRRILIAVLKDCRTRKSIEAFFIAK